MDETRECKISLRNFKSRGLKASTHKIHTICAILIFMKTVDWSPEENSPPSNSRFLKLNHPQAKGHAAMVRWGHLWGPVHESGFWTRYATVMVSWRHKERGKLAKWKPCWPCPDQSRAIIAQSICKKTFLSTVSGTLCSSGVLELQVPQTNSSTLELHILSSTPKGRD